MLAATAFLQSDDAQPAYHQSLPGRRVPVRFQRGMAPDPHPLTFVVTEAAFQRLQPRPEQRTQAMLQERAAVTVILRYAALAAPQRRRQHAEPKLRRQFKHHAACQTGFQSALRLLHRPPAGTRAVRRTYFAAAWLRGCKSLRERPSISHNAASHTLPPGILPARQTGYTITYVFNQIIYPHVYIVNMGFFIRMPRFIIIRLLCA